MTDIFPPYFINSWLIALLLNSFLIAIAWLLPKKLLTPLGYLNAWVLGVIVWGTLGWQGYTIVMFYFLVGSAVTKIGMAEKEAAGIAEKRSGMRGPENVWGSALTATICALITLIVDAPFKELLILGYVASFATKLSDTSASEVGKAYGKSTFLAFIATNIESLIGATLQERFQFLTNEVVNFINTTIGAIVAIAIAGARIF